MRLLSLLLLSLSASLLAAEPREQTTIYVAVNEAEFRPYSWVESGQLQGADRAVLDAFGEYLGTKLEYLPLPRLRALEQLKQGEVQLLYPDDRFWTTAAKEGVNLLYSDAAVTNQTGFFLVKEKACDAATSLESIGTLLGWVPEGYYGPIARGEVILQRFATVEQMLKAGLAGGVDAVFAERQSLDIYINAHHPYYSTYQFCSALPSSIGHFRLSTVEQPELIERFNQFLKAHPEVIDAIKARYRLPK